MAYDIIKSGTKPQQEEQKDNANIVEAFSPINARQYLQDGKHLPPFLKDFHDQKNFFHAMHEQFEGSSSLNKINKEDAHTYVIDCFLWWMGLNGYKLQKIRSKDFRFYEPEETIVFFNKQRKSKFNLFGILNR